MSPCSGAVLGGAAVLSSPALWRAFVEGSASIELALTRYLVSVAVCWALLALLVTLVGPARGRGEGQLAAEPSEPSDASGRPEVVDVGAANHGA